MREELLGYLLGALEPDEMQRVADAVARDPALAAELDRVRESLRPLEEAEELFEPPGDLVARTMAAIPSRSAGAPQPAEEPTHSSRAAAVLSPSPSRERPVAGWRLSDVVTTMAAALLLAGLILPSILRERAAARNDACQSQLRQAGIALMEYLQRNPEGRFPHLALEGPEAFAGIYRIRIQEPEPIDRRPMWCPALAVPRSAGRMLPTPDELSQLSPADLAWTHLEAGGDYAYNLGFVQDGRYVAPKNSGRKWFALLADAPIFTLDGWRFPHERAGVNTLFEDGHVRFITQEAAEGLGDHLFLNRSGRIEAGVDPNDSTLGPSHVGPFWSLPRYRW